MVKMHLCIMHDANSNTVKALKIAFPRQPSIVFKTFC